VNRLGRILGGLLFAGFVLVVAELTLRAFGVGEAAPLHDPFSGFSSAVPVFEAVLREDGTPIYRLSPARQVGAPDGLEPEPQREFTREKAEGVYRIFVIGGSSAAGHPYTTRYAFSSWLERRLRAALPDLRVEVVNAALASYASRRLVPVVEEIARHEPDLLIVYMGHNEWAEAQYYRHLLDLDPRLFRLLEWMYRTRIYRLISGIIEQTGPDPAAVPVDTDARENAVEMFGVIRDRVDGVAYPTERELAYRDLLYEHNLRSMVLAMQAVNADVVLVTLSQNFSDWPPAASAHRTGLDAEALGAWERYVADGDRLAREGDCAATIAAYDRALEIDDAYADLHFRIAACERRLGRLERARASYRRASDLDRVPHGAPTAYNDIVRAIASEAGALLVDAEAALERESGDGLVGDDLFLDFAHPNLRAHQVIAAAIADALRAADLPVAKERWREGAYADPDPASLYRADPRLRIGEFRTRVFICVIAPRDYCDEEARTLLSLEPENWAAKAALDRQAREERPSTHSKTSGPR